MNLFHYTKNPLVFDRERRYAQRCDEKPKGLWVSVGDEWAEYCRSEEWREDTLAHRVQIHLRPDARILVIQDGPGLLRFDIDFGDVAGINWEAVAREYQGIIIAPYLHEYRLSKKVPWYYDWDIASGCIWDLNAIESVTTGQEEPCTESSAPSMARRALS